MKKVKRFYFSVVFYALVFMFCFYTLKYFISDAVEVSLLLSTMYFLLLFVRKSESSLVPNFLHNLAGLFLGAAWIGFVTMIFLNILDIFIHLTKTGRFIGLAISGILTLAAILNNLHISSKYFTIQSDLVKSKVRIAQISDLHVTGPNAKKAFDKVLSQVMSENPDVIAISGDLVDVPQVPKAECFDLLRQIKTPILFVTGNHDYYAGADYVTSFLEERGVTVLRGKSKTIRGIHFTGFDDPTGKEKLKPQLENYSLPKDKFKVLLYHQPKHVAYVASKGFHLMLSGHTHGGQLYPFNYLVRLQFKYVVGLHKIEQMLLYINPGTGTWEIPMRIGSRNTIAVFDIVPTKAKK